MDKKQKRKFLIWFTIIIAGINFLLAIGFVVYLYFWFKAH